MYQDGKIWLASNDDKKVFLYPEMANRHGLIAGASGTGKTVTLKVVAEGFSDMGVPVFMADIKGDVSGMCLPGNAEKMKKRLPRFGITDFTFEGCPVCFWDIYGEKGLPVKATIESMGPMLLARLMGLSEVQTDVLNIIFHICKDNDWELIDLNDLRKAVQYVNENKNDYIAEYGNMSTASLGAVQRSLLVLEDLEADKFFGEPELDITDWFNPERAVINGKGVVNILHSVKLAHNPTLYATFLLWMMTKLFEILPEEGDMEKPKMVFFFDEAHMLFNDAPKTLVQKVEQVVKLIRSKGVGIYFISQSPSDIPDKVLAQLSNRIQHALRAYTPAEQKAVKSAAQAFRQNKSFKTEDAIMELGVGEALISCLDENGSPSIVERAWVLPPKTLLAEAPQSEYDRIIKNSVFFYKYARNENRESAEEKIGAINEQKSAEKEAAKKAKEAEKEAARKAKESEKKSTSSKKTQSKTEKYLDRAAGNAVGAIGSGIGRAILKNMFKK